MNNLPKEDAKKQFSGHQVKERSKLSDQRSFVAELNDVVTDDKPKTMLDRFMLAMKNSPSPQ